MGLWRRLYAFIMSRSRQKGPILPLFAPICQHDTDEGDDITPPLRVTVITPTFLTLPGELRNRVYRLVLVEPEPIQITDTSHTQPPLFRVCRQIRDEVLKIWCQETVFHPIITDLTYRVPPTHWFHLPGTGMTRKFIPTGAFKWSNLHHWLQKYHGGKLTWHLYGQPQDTEARAVVEMFNIVLTLKDRQWADVEPVLESVKSIIKEGAGAWVVD